MTDNTSIQRKSPIALLDEFIFIKNGYSFFKHLVPFAISALLLLTLSIPSGNLPSDNLLLKLVNLLKVPSWIWLPAALLTTIVAVVYIVSINVQNRQAYLWSDGDIRRTIGTSLSYIILCTLMAFVVLRSVSLCKATSDCVKTPFNANHILV